MAGYSYKQRADKGFDFFDPNGKKITVDQYTQGTGANKQALVSQFAKAGDAVSQKFTQPQSNLISNAFKQLGNFGNDTVKNLGVVGKDIGQGVNTVGNAVGGFVLPGVAKLANQGFGVVENTGANIAGDVQKALGDKAGGQKTIDSAAADINKRLLQKGAGLFGQGGIYNSVSDLHNASVPDVIKKGGGTGLEALSEVVPVARVAKGATLGAKVANNAIAGAVSGGLGNTGAQLIENGKVNPLQVIENAGIGGAFGGAIPVAGALVKPASALAKNAGKDATKAVVSGINDVRPSVIASQHPSVTGFDDQYQLLAKQFDNLPPSRARDQVSQAMARNRQDRLATQKGIEKQINQGGYVKIPGTSGQETAKVAQTAPLEPNNPTALEAQNLSPETLQKQESLSSPNISTADYIKQQTNLQESARKQGDLSTSNKVKGEIRSKLIDSLAPIEDTLAKANKNGANIKISDANHITPQLDRVLRADTIAGQFAKDNGLHDIIQNVPDTKEFDQYLIAKHAADLEKNGITTGRNSAADAQLVQALVPKYEAHAQAINKYNQNLLDTAAGYGLISKDLASSLKKQYPNYVPANRIFGEGENATFKGAGGGKASRSTQTVVQRIKGSERQIESPLASIINKTQDVVKQGETNKAASILASYKDLEGNPFGLRELKSTETVGTKPTISFLDNGKVRRFETTPEVAAAAKSLNKEQIGILGKIVRIPTRVLRLGATGVNAGFALANIAKDMASAAINTEHPFRASALNPTVLKKATAAAANHGSKSYGELVREGAGGTSFDIARDQPRQNVAKIRAEKNIGTKAMYTVTHPGELLRAVENTIGRSEEFTRAIQYFGNKEAGLKQGLTESEAKRYGAHAARNNTINFARAGDYGAVLNSALPYLNAGVQGSRTLLRNIKNHPAQTLTKIAVLGALPTATITAWNLSDPDRAAAYKDISEYEKEGNFIIVPPHPTKDEKTGRWNVIKIPVSQELANLNNVVRNTVEQATGQDGSLTAGKVLGDLVGTTTSLSAQDPRQLVGQFVPQALKPAVETLTNQNLFTGNSIVPDSQKNLPAQDQYGNYTSNTAIALGKLTGQSPRVIDNAIKTAAGGAGQTAVNTVDKLLSATGIENTNPVQGKSIGDSVANRFLGAASIPASDKADKVFESAKKQLIATPAYKSLSVEDQAKALNRLQTDSNAVIYNQEDTANPTGGYTAKPLTANQSKLAQGLKDLTDYTKPSVSSLSSTKLTANDPSYNFLSDLDGVDTASKDSYLTKQVDPKYQPLVDNINSALPEGYPKLPNTNAVAKVYADFAKAKADGNWSALQNQKESQTAVKKAYQTQLTPNQQFVSTLSDADILSAVDNGQIEQPDLDSVINLDNTLHKLGFSQNISNKTRAILGYNTLASKSSSSTSSKKKKGFTIPTTKTFDRIKNTGDIYKILKAAKV